jgi:hypothetical protein
MFQHGLTGSTPLSGLSFWRSSSIAEEAHVEAVSLAGSDQRARAVPADRPAGALKIGRFLKNVFPI